MTLNLRKTEGNFVKGDNDYVNKLIATLEAKKHSRERVPVHIERHLPMLQLFSSNYMSFLLNSSNLSSRVLVVSALFGSGNDSGGF